MNEGRKVGMLDNHRNRIEIQWTDTKVLNLNIVPNGSSRYIRSADDVLICEARRGKKYVYMIFQYEHDCTCSVSGLDIVNLRIIAELPVRP